MPTRYPVSPNLREFIYEALYSLPESKRFDLKGVYYKIGRSKYQARRFCDSASHEQIFHLAAMMGIKWFIILFDDNKKDRYLRQLLDKFKKEKGNTDLKDIIERKIYITSDKKFVHGLGLISDSIATGTYKQTLELSKAGFHARGWYKNINLPNIKKTTENQESIKYLIRTILSSYFVTQHTSLQQYDVMMLLFFYENLNNYIGVPMLENKFIGLLGQLKIKRGINRLIKKEFIEKHLAANRKDYQITSAGIMEVNRIVESVLKSNQFNVS